MSNSSLPKVTLYSDWWAVPNPWKGGYGIILQYKDIKKEFSQGYTLSTNNRMELTGVITGLWKLTKKSQVEVYTDSQYTINGIEKWWAQKWQSNNWMRTKTQKATNADLWEKLLLLVEKHEVTFHWVKWHNGHPENERCDELATLALEWNNLIEDTWFNWEEQAVLTKKSKFTTPPAQKTTWKKTKVSQEWDTCWKCGTAVIKKIPKKKKLKPWQTFYYEYFLYCPWCSTNYMIEAWKREL